MKVSKVTVVAGDPGETNTLVSSGSPKVRRDIVGTRLRWDPGETNSLVSGGSPKVSCDNDAY